MRSSPALTPQLVALALAILAIAGLAFFSVPAPPDSRVASYLEATARGDGPAALSTWELWDCCPTEELKARRADFTRELAALGAGREHRVLFTEWWTTCCIPTITDDPAHAGRARIFVSAVDRSGLEHELVFDVQAEQRVSLMGPDHDLGRWILREVYRRGERSAMGGPEAPLTEEAAIRSAQSATGIGMMRDTDGLAPGTRFGVKTSTVGELKLLLGSEDFVVPSDPARRVWVIAASGPAYRGGIVAPASAVVVLDMDEHTLLGTDIYTEDTWPDYFDRLPYR